MALLFFFLAGFCNGIMDTLAFHYEVSRFGRNPKTFKPSFWNPTDSWRNKYKDGDPTKGPKFRWSTTVLVGVTDGWHLFQTIMLSCFYAAAVFHAPFFEALWAELLVFAVLYRAAFGAGFYLSYYQIFK